MSKLTRRKLITTGLAATAGASGLAVAAKLAKRYGLIPPDSSGIYGPGETLTYAAQRVCTRHTLAREFSPRQISTKPFANEVDLWVTSSSAFSRQGSPTGALRLMAWSLARRPSR